MKKLLSPTNSFFVSVFFILFLFFHTAMGQENPKIQINKQAIGTASSTAAPAQTTKSGMISTSKKSESKHKKKKSKSKKGLMHTNPSQNDARLDSIKAVKNKQKGIK